MQNSLVTDLHKTLACFLSVRKSLIKRLCGPSPAIFPLWCLPGQKVESSPSGWWALGRDQAPSMITFTWVMASFMWYQQQKEVSWPRALIWVPWPVPEAGGTGHSRWPSRKGKGVSMLLSITTSGEHLGSRVYPPSTGLCPLGAVRCWYNLHSHLQQTRAAPKLTQMTPLSYRPALFQARSKWLPLSFWENKIVLFHLALPLPLMMFWGEVCCLPGADTPLTQWITCKGKGRARDEELSRCSDPRSHGWQSSLSQGETSRLSKSIPLPGMWKGEQMAESTGQGLGLW